MDINYLWTNLTMIFLNSTSMRITVDGLAMCVVQARGELVQSARSFHLYWRDWTQSAGWRGKHLYPLCQLSRSHKSIWKMLSLAMFVLSIRNTTEIAFLQILVSLEEIEIKHEECYKILYTPSVTWLQCRIDKIKKKIKEENVKEGGCYFKYAFSLTLWASLHTTYIGNASEILSGGIE